MHTKIQFLFFCFLLCYLPVAWTANLDSLKQVVGTMPQDSGKVEVLLQISSLLYSGDEALVYAEQGLQLAKKLQVPQLLGKSYSAISWAYGLDEMEKKTAYLDSAKWVFEEMGDLDGQGAIYNAMGAIFIEYGDAEKALEFLEKSYEIYEQTNNESRKANALNNIGVVLNEIGRTREAIPKYKEALDFRLKEQPPQPSAIGRAYFGLGTCYRAMDSLNLATDYYLKSYGYRLMGNRVDVFENLTTLADMICYAQEQHLDTTEIIKKIQTAGFPSSYALLDSVMVIPGVNDRGGMLYTVLDVRRRKSIIDGNYHKAYEILVEQKKLDEESKLSASSLEALADVKMKYEKEQLTTELLQEEVDHQKKTNQVNTLVFFLCLSVGVLIIGVLIYQYRIRTNRLLLAEAKQEQQEVYMRSVLEGQEKERERIARDLHDGLGNLLSTLKVNIGNLPSDYDQESQKVYVKASKMVDEACTSVRKIAHEMMPMALKRLGLIKALEDLMDNMDQSHEFSAQFRVYGEEQPLSEGTNSMLYRIVQELVNNIIKYAQAKEVLLQMTFSDEWLNLTIEDDGIGFKPDRIAPNEGMGLKSVAFRVDFIGGEYEIDSRPGWAL